MVLIKFSVKGQILQLDTHQKATVTSDTLNYFKCKFDFDKTWDGFDVRVYFKNASFNITKSAVLDASGYCFIPWEVLAHTGVILCNVTGIKYVNGEPVRITAGPVKLFVHNSNPLNVFHQREEGTLEPDNQLEPTPTEYEQFIKNVSDYAKDANAAKTAAEAAEYKIRVMTVSASAGEPGSDPVVTKTEYSDHYNLDFLIPRGEQGEPGPQGEKGDKGNANLWYGTCDTAGDTAAKVVTTTTGDFTLEVGNMVRVLFKYANDGTTASTLSVDGAVATRIYHVDLTSGSKRWRAGEVVDFVYVGQDRFVMSDGGVASTSYYGATILTDSVSSTSTTSASTPNSVKQAYDLANSKQDALVSGTNIKTVNNNSLLGSGDLSITAGVSDVQVDGVSVVTEGVAEVPSEVFLATYGTTTSAEIETAYQANKVIAVVYSGITYYLHKRLSSTEHVFTTAIFGDGYRATCSADSWTKGVLSCHEVPSGGTTGQVLAKKNNTNYATEWITPPTKVSDLINDSGYITLADLPIYNGGVQ